MTLVNVRVALRVKEPVGQIETIIKQPATELGTRARPVQSRCEASGSDAPGVFHQMCFRWLPDEGLRVAPFEWSPRERASGGNPRA
jgi:hypothetical protein